MEAIDIYGDPGQYAAAIAKVPRQIVLLHATHMCLAEVHNGGFLQFFWNNTGVVCPEAIEGFYAMGMPALAGLVGKAAAQLGVPFPRDRDERWDALLAASECDEEKLTQIMQHSDSFYAAFVEATESLAFNSLDRQLWELAPEENGGYQQAATRFAQLLPS